MTRDDDLTGLARGLLPGTPVLTPRGLVPAEALEPGMLVLAVSGAAAPFRHVAAVRLAGAAGPLVRIRAGALDDGTPQEDLLLPAGHALLIDGALIAAGALVDGHGIRHEAADGPLRLVEILLPEHDAILAAGAAVETATPGLDAPDCAPRRAPDAALRAMLSWRAERIGWAAADPAPPPEPALTIEEELATSAHLPFDLARRGEAP